MKSSRGLTRRIAGLMIPAAMESFERLLGRDPRHTEAEVVGWAKRLRYFTFMGEVSSGHMDLYEELRMRLNFAGREDLLRLLQALDPKPTGEGGKSPISSQPDLLQPGHCRLAGSTCFFWVEAEFIDVTCAADSHVSAANVDEAVRIEAQLDALQLQGRVNRTLARHSNCVSAENFPERFAR